MKNNYAALLNSKLFEGIPESDFILMLKCIAPSDKKYRKNESVLHEGDSVNFVGILLSGALKITKTDYSGNEIIIAEIYAGDIFAEVFACAEISFCPVSITASGDSHVLFFDYNKTIAACASTCKHHQKLILNMLKIIANKSLYLNRRIDIISKRSLRDKILTYFGYESHGAKKFSIPLNREELASFLCADRSALSNELSKMRREGIIDYHKNNFTLLC